MKLVIRVLGTAPFSVLRGDDRSDTIYRLPSWDTRGIYIAGGHTALVYMTQKGDSYLTFR